MIEHNKTCVRSIVQSKQAVIRTDIAHERNNECQIQVYSLSDSSKKAAECYSAVINYLKSNKDKTGMH